MITQDFINSDINVLGVFDLLDYDHSFDLLANQLKTIKKDQYTPLDKIIILHNDTEYFYQGHKLGFTMCNLLTCWRDLDIPYHIMVIYANYSDLGAAIEPFIVHHLDRPLVIPTLVNNHSCHSILAAPSQVERKKILHNAFCLIGVARQHRIKFFQYLSKNNLFDYIKVNYNSDFHKKLKNNSIRDRQSAALQSAKNLSSTIYTSPHRINETCFSQSRYKDIVDLSSVAVYPCNNLVGDVSSFYHDFFLEVVLETVFDYPHVFISEKTLKPLLFKTPFVMFGAKDTLLYLKKHKFKTFDSFWDESYDTESDPHLRFLKCCKVVQSIITKPISELVDMYSAMIPILEHNHIRLLEYVETEYKSLYNKINL